MSATVSAAQPATEPAWKIWTGRVMSALPVLVLLMSASMKLMQKPEMVAGFTGKYGYPAGSLLLIAATELTCTALYLIPQTAVLGAILLTGYLGGAVSTHVRAGEAFVVPILVGVLLWGGLFLRDPRIRQLLPLRTRA